MPNKLPQGWVECQFSDCIDKISISNKLKQKEYLLEGEYPVIDQGHFFISGYYNERNLLLEIGQPVIIFGDHTRCFKYVDFPFIAGADGIKVLKPKQFFNSKLFYYFCLALKFPNKGYSRHYQYLEKTIMHIPPQNEQRRIVEKIESEFAKIDEGLEHLENAKEQIKQYRQSVLKSAFSIKNKNEKCLDEITNKINDGTHKTPTYIEKGIPFISVKDIKNKQIFFDNCKFISEDEHKILFKRCNPEYGDVLITKSGTIGRTAIVNTDKVFDLFVSVALLKPKKDLVTSEFLMYALDNYIAHIDIKQEVKGGVIKNLHIEDLKKITICLPPLCKQKKIVEEIEKRFAIADEVEKVVEDNIEKAKQLKQSILKKAFEGNLVPQEPTDEPASTLLEKIKQERSKK